jgi:hypothetical protein
LIVTPSTNMDSWASWNVMVGNLDGSSMQASYGSQRVWKKAKAR